MKDDRVFVKHILHEIAFLVEQTNGIDFETFRKSEVLSRACARSFQIMGEAAKNLSQGFRDKHANIDWKKIAGMRNRIVHYYFGVKWIIVWDVTKNELPRLKKELETILTPSEKSVLPPREDFHV